MISISFAVEIILVMLLLVACGYAIILSKRLQRVRESQESLAATIRDFDKAAGQARENLSTMHGSQSDAERNLHRLVTQATVLVNELSVMVNAGDNIAGRIEGAIDEVRNVSKPAHPQDRQH